MKPIDCVVVPVSYFAPVGMYSVIVKSKNVIFDLHENFLKQTMRSRCEIYGANGKQLLSVPVEKRGNHIAAKDVRISYKEDWQKIHWRSIVSAYRNSPYFEYYSDELEPFFVTKTELLFDLNMSLHQVLLKLLKVEINFEFTETYIADYGNTILDLRNERTQLPQISQYNQVFEERYGYIPNLSILDLLFNSGPDSLKILSGK